jgi:predicted NAD/FAD-dependent oxidoreductase
MISLIRPLFVSKAPASVIIVGAGVAGMSAARALQSHRLQATVLERAPRAGGRLETLMFDGGHFDTGHQFLTARDWRARRVISQWAAQGLLREWCRAFPGHDGVVANDRFARYRPLRGMATLADHMAQGLDIRLNTPVARVLWRGTHWEVRTEDDKEFSAEALLLAMPLPEALALIDAGNYETAGSVRSQLEPLAYDPCLAVLATLEGPSAVREPGAIRLHEPLLWIADNHRKGISPGAHAVTIHAGPHFSRAHLEDDDAAVAAKVLDAAAHFLHSPVRRTLVRRWKHARPRAVSEQTHCVVCTDPPLVLAGDAFGPAGPVEVSLLSGLDAAEFLAAERRSLIADLLGL